MKDEKVHDKIKVYPALMRECSVFGGGGLWVVEVGAALKERYPDMPTLLAAIRKRPGMFLGHPTVSGLNLLLSGIGFAEDFHGVPAADRVGGFDNVRFERWVESRYNPRRLSLNSFSLAAHLSESEAAGFDLWFRWHDEFVGGSSEAASHAVPGT